MSADEDAERRQEEWTALLAIYGEEAVEGAPDALEWRVTQTKAQLIVMRSAAEGPAGASAVESVFSLPSTPASWRRPEQSPAKG